MLITSKSVCSSNHKIISWPRHSFPVLLDLNPTLLIELSSHFLRFRSPQSNPSNCSFSDFSLFSVFCTPRPHLTPTLIDLSLSSILTWWSSWIFEWWDRPKYWCPRFSEAALYAASQQKSTWFLCCLRPTLSCRNHWGHGRRGDR